MACVDGISSVSLYKRKQLQYLPIVKGLIGSTCSDILLDSGSSISLVSSELVNRCSLSIFPKPALNVTTAACTNMRLNTGVILPICIGKLVTNHEALVSQHLVAPVILGTDFLSKHGIQIDFKAEKIVTDDLGTIWPDIENDTHFPSACTIHQHTSYWDNSYTVAAIIPDDPDGDDCSIPLFNRPPVYSIPNCESEYYKILTEYQELFSSLPGKTTTVQHQIIT